MSSDETKGNGEGCAAGMGADLKKAEEERKLKETLGRIKNKIVVLSGKGGVGKSTVSVNLAVALALKGYSVGLLDVDIHGPSIPKLLGLELEKIAGDGDGNLFPVVCGDNLTVISIGFMLPDSDEPVVWRGPLKFNAIKQFMRDVVWGDLDYLIIDSPPGTGDEPLAVCQILENPTGAVVVTTPQDVALIDVRKSITFCKKLNMPVLGVVENMSGMVCPHCGQTIEVFKSGGGERMAGEMGVPFLGSIPLHPGVARLGDEGRPFSIEEGAELDPVKRAFQAIADAISEREEVRA